MKNKKDLLCKAIEKKKAQFIDGSAVESERIFIAKGKCLNCP